MDHLDSNAPVACTLNDTDFRERRTFARQRLVPKIIKSERTEIGLTCWVSPDSGVKEDLETFVRLEQQCCEFLNFTIFTDGDDVSQPAGLRIEGPSEAAATIDMFAKVVMTHSEGVEVPGNDAHGCGCGESLRIETSNADGNRWLQRISRTSWSGIVVGGLLLLACELPIILAAFGLGGLSAGSIALQPSPMLENTAIVIAVIGVLALLISRRVRT